MMCSLTTESAFDLRPRFAQLTVPLAIYLLQQRYVTNSILKACTFQV